MDIINSKDRSNEIGSLYNLLEMANAEGSDVKFYQNKVIDSGNAKYIYRFAFDVAGANLKVLKKGIDKTKDEQYINAFNKYVLHIDTNVTVDKK